METLDYGAFSRKMHGRLRAAGVPLNGTIEVTRRCPLECAHCYNNLPMSDRSAVQRELTYEEHCRILDEISAAGCLWLLYTGGEIFARRDFLDIYRYAKRKGFLITLFTNGNMVTPAVADALVEYPPFAIEITLYGRTRETYERLTGIPGSYDRCMRGVELLRDRRLPLRLKTVAVTINKHEVFDMQRFAEEELGVEFKFDAMMNPRLDCSQAPLAVRLSPEECVELDLIDPRRMDEWNIFADRALRIPELPPPSEELYGCGGGLTSFAINPYGELSICTMSQQELFDLRRGSFEEGWTSYLRQIRARRVTRLTKCRACQLQEMCGMCPANGELESGDAETPVDFLCHTAHLRAMAFGFPIPAHGECEYCAGGEKHGELVAEAARLKTVHPHDPVTPSRRLLPMVNVMSTGCATGGCSSCRDAREG